MKISILVPLYNEEKTIGNTLRKLTKLDLPGVTKEIIVINDGSTDRSYNIASTFGKKIKILSHKRNRGKGMAIRKGLKNARGEIIIIQDADEEYDPVDIPNLLKPFKNRSTEVVYGSRSLGNNKPSHWTYNTGGKAITLITNLLYGTRITDEPTGYKLFRSKTLKSLKLKSKGFEFCPEVTAKLAKKSITISEVPITYNPRPISEKKIKWQDGLAAIYFLLKYRFFD